MKFIDKILISVVIVLALANVGIGISLKNDLNEQTFGNITTSFLSDDTGSEVLTKLTSLISETNTELDTKLESADLNTLAELNAIVADATIVDSTVSTLSSLSITESQISDLTHTTDTNLTQEEVEDFAGGMVTGNTETLITVGYQDADGTIDYEVQSDLSQYAWGAVDDGDIPNAITVTGYMQDEDINTFSELQSWVTDGTLVKAGTLTDTKYCIYDSASASIVCNSDGGGGLTSVAPTDMDSDDFGDFTCNGTTCSLDETYLTSDDLPVLYAEDFAGSDIGAKVNAAYASLTVSGGKIILPAGEYEFSTPIDFDVDLKRVYLEGQGYATKLTYTGAINTVAITINSGQEQNIGTVLSEFRLFGESSSRTNPTTGVYVGGSNGASNSVINNLTIDTFGINLRLGANAYNVKVQNNNIRRGGHNVYINTASNSGEGFQFLNNWIVDPGNGDADQCFYVAAGAVASLQIMGGSIDNCQLYILDSNKINISQTHFENAAPSEYDPYDFIYIWQGSGAYQDISLDQCNFWQVATNAAQTTERFIWNGGIVSATNITIRRNDLTSDTQSDHFIENFPAGGGGTAYIRNINDPNNTVLSYIDDDTIKYQEAIAYAGNEPIGTIQESDGDQIFYNGGAGRMTLTEEGYFGLLTSSPKNNFPLTIQANGEGGFDDLIQYRDSGGNDEWHFGIFNSDSLSYTESGVADYRLYLQAGGNIGIGDGSPDSMLEVVNTGSEEYLMLSSASGNDGDIFIVNNSGDVGIGDITPSYKLDVNGTFRSTGALTVGAYTLPATDGTNGQVLATDGAGVLTWTSISGGHDAVTLAGTPDYLTLSGQEITLGTVDVSDDTNLTAGDYLTLTDDDIDIDTEVITDEKCIWFEDPTDADDFNSIWKAPVALTLTAIWAESDQTVNLDLMVDDGTPADVNGTDIAPAAGEAEDTSLSGDTTMAAGDELDLAITSVASTPTWLSVCWKFTVDD